MNLQSLEDLLSELLSDLYDAEQQLVEALPKLADAAENEDLKAGFEEHLEQTREHLKRLDQIFDQINQKPLDRRSLVMQALIDQGQEVVDSDAEDQIRDLALTCAAQKVEHYEIAAYASAVGLADQLDLESIADLLNGTLDEEQETADNLMEIAESIASEEIQEKDDDNDE